MSLVKFATICDRCSKRGPEYESYPSCEECGGDICPDCTAEELTGWDVDHRATVLCVECKREEEL